MLSCLSDFANCTFYYIERRIYSSALEHCRKIKFTEYVHQTLIYTNYDQCYAD